MSSEAASHRPCVPLTVRLFGAFYAGRGGRPLDPTRTQKEHWLLALLLLRQEDALDRPWLAGLLWPDSSEERGLQYLRRGLSELRHALGPDAARLVAPRPRAIRLDASGMDVDVLAFDAAIASGGRDALQHAVELYRGPLLEECYEEWVLPERQAREQAYLSALETLAAESSSTEAAGYLRRLVAMDPARESAQRSLITALAASGDTAAAVQAYRAFRIYLQRELRTEPDADTTRLYRRIREERRSKAEEARIDIPRRPPRPPRGRLPRPLTSLVGREEEIAGVVECLRTARLVTLTGPGGVGKTRLAIAAAGHAEADFPHGVCFVDLTPVSDPSLVPEVVGTALGISGVAGAIDEGMIGYHLGAKPPLLVLDNCEHLADRVAELAQSLLQDCPDLRILATSREPLGIGGERHWRVPPFAVPPPQPDSSSGTGTDLMGYPSVRLFVDRAACALPGFRLTHDNADAVARICRQVDGLPLALELAAGRVAALSLADVAAHLEDSFHLLAGDRRDAPPRQRTLRATLDWSYRLLQPGEKAVLRSLSTLSGTWTLEAASAICPSQERCGPGRPSAGMVLASLVDNSLVQVVPPKDTAPAGAGNRYRLLEMVRQYAAERLEEAGEAEDGGRRHSTYYLAVLSRLHTEQGTARYHAALEMEYANVRSAVDWTLGRPASAAQAIEAARQLDAFWYSRGLHRDGWEWWNKLLPLVRQQPAPLRAEPLCRAFSFAFSQSDLATVEALAQEALAAARDAGRASLEARVLIHLGDIADRRGNLDQARCLYEKALAAARTASDPGHTAWALVVLSANCARRGETQRALDHIEQAILLRDAAEDLSAAHLLQQRGALLKDHGDRRRARADLEEALALAREDGNLTQLGATLAALGDLERMEGHRGRARALLEESLALRREIADWVGLAHSLRELGTMAEEDGALERAQALLQESLTLRRKMGDPFGAARVLLHLGRIAFRLGAVPLSRNRYREVLVLGRDLKDGRLVNRALVYLSGARFVPRVGALLLGAASRALADVTMPIWWRPEGLDDECAAGEALRALLGDQPFEDAFAAGRTLSLAQVLSEAGLDQAPG